MGRTDKALSPEVKAKTCLEEATSKLDPSLSGCD